MAERLLQSHPGLWPVLSFLTADNAAYDEQRPIDARSFRIEFAMIVGALSVAFLAFRLFGNA